MFAFRIIYRDIYSGKFIFLFKPNVVCILRVPINCRAEGETRLEDWMAEIESQKGLKFTKIKYGCG